MPGQAEGRTRTSLSACRLRIGPIRSLLIVKFRVPSRDERGKGMWDQNDPVKHSLKELGSELSQRRATEDMAKERVRRPLRRGTKKAVGVAIVPALAVVVAAVNVFTPKFPSGTTRAPLPTAR